MIPLYATLLLLAAPVSAQTIGGGTETLFQWDGRAKSDLFGTSVSNAGDVNGDDFVDVIVGAWAADPGGLTWAGSAYVYSGADGSLLHQWDGRSRWDFFGDSVSGAGDVNVDGFDDLLVGASYADPRGIWDAGSVFVYSFNHFLQANTATISAAAGGALSLDLDFPKAAGFDEYKVLISATGTGPTNYGVDIPLTQDSLVVDTFRGNYTVPTTDFHGILDSNGDAVGSLTVPAGIPSTFVGKVYYLAAVASQPGQLPRYSSVAVAVTITP